MNQKQRSSDRTGHRRVAESLVCVWWRQRVFVRSRRRLQTPDGQRTAEVFDDPFCEENRRCTLTVARAGDEAMWFESGRYEGAPVSFLNHVGRVFTVFDERTQDSGNVSYGVEVGSTSYFVKTAGAREVSEPLSYEQRMELLRNAARIAVVVRSRLLPRLHAVLEGDGGPLLVYEWVDGESLYAEAPLRSEPESALSRFRTLPTHVVANAIERVIELHSDIVSQGWIAADFYDGCLLFDFASHALHVIDLDHYWTAPFVNEAGRLPGSSRYMAPEEFEIGARVDARTTVFNLGRLAFELLGDGRRAADSFRGSSARFAVAERATIPDPAGRFADPAGLLGAWRQAR